jgi:predicted lipoprotein with Yx(FWY)xxD motif
MLRRVAVVRVTTGRKRALRSTLALALVALSLGLVACGDDDDSSDAGTETGPASGSSAAGGGVEKERRSAGSGKDQAAGTTVATADSEFGEILFDGDDRAIYAFDKESAERSECYGACAEAWPPVLTEGEPQASGGVDAKLLGTTERDDGTTQVTYADQPLYYYVDDPRGEVLCHDVEEFGGLWLVVEPSGDPVQ